MKPRILVSRPAFDETLRPLRRRFNVEENQTGGGWSDEEFRRRVADKEGLLISGADRIDGPLLEAAPRLKVVCNVAVGYNNIDLAACTARGVLATNTPGVLDETTADLTWALLLAAARRLPDAERFLRAGEWQGWKNDAFLGVDVHHATLGIIGLGRIGQAVARRARGFSMRVLYYNRHRLPRQVEQELDAKYVTFARLLREADFISLNLPYSRAVHHLIGAKEIARMKPGAVLVNAARGGLVDDAALIAALRSRRIAAAGLDVFENEPEFNPGFLKLDNVALVPHIGSATRATRVAMFQLALKNLVAALAGKRPPSLLNPDAWANRRR
jgi:lactate dehydrogenase-like 2-hydroxyacid dehydrogenase